MIVSRLSCIFAVYKDNTNTYKSKITIKSSKMQDNLINLTQVRMNDDEKAELQKLVSEWKSQMLPKGVRGKNSDFLRWKLLQPNPMPIIVD